MQQVEDIDYLVEEGGEEMPFLRMQKGGRYQMLSSY